MEDVLEVYHRPYDPARPQVCLDESNKQLLGHVRKTIAASPRTPARVDDEYTRHGTANIFAAVEPLTGRALVEVTERRTAIDMARFFKRLSDELFPLAKVIVLVMDNLNIHSLSCLYEAFPPDEARRLATRFEVHHTPKHGSWLNVAEIFLSNMAIQCLAQRIDDIKRMRTTIDAWLAARAGRKVNWRFDIAGARVKLKRLYPSLQ
jgi:hypothetical protein